MCVNSRTVWPGIDTSPAFVPGPAFFRGTAVDVARRLIGCSLHRVFADGMTASGIIVETEAYRQTDPASHSFAGITERTSVMFGRAGLAYIYLIYGVHSCLNVVCEPEGVGAAVLIRAIHPTSGYRRLWSQRYGDATTPPNELPADTEKLLDPIVSGTRRSIVNLTSGPGKVCQALALAHHTHNGIPLDGPPNRDSLTLLVTSEQRGSSESHRHSESREITVSTRVGISRAIDKLWRFALSGDPFVSRPTPATNPK